MLWPLVLPCKITFGIHAGLIALLTLFAPALRWRRGRVLAITTLLACLAFIPSCVGIMAVIDSQRFGLFQYPAYDDVNDFRIERFLSPKARNISVDKYATGHRARYSISESDLTAYLDGLWEEYGEYSVIPRAKLDDGAETNTDHFNQEYGDLPWPEPKAAIVLHSPVERDGGGATYVFDRATGTAYHRAGYW